MPNVGIWEILLILLVILIVFGPKRLPEMGRSLGRGMREFKDSIADITPREEDFDTPAEQALPVSTVVETTAATIVVTSEAETAEPVAVSGHVDGGAEEPRP